MNYWLLVTTLNNWNIITQKNVAGISEKQKNAFSKVHEGDKCLIYIRGGRKPEKISEPAVDGVFEVVSSNYDNVPIFDAPPTHPAETYPLRFQLKRVRPLTEPIPFKPLTSKLSFILNPQRWGSYLQGRGLIPLSEKDYQIIVASLQKERQD